MQQKKAAVLCAVILLCCSGCSKKDANTEEVKKNNQEVRTESSTEEQLGSISEEITEIEPGTGEGAPSVEIPDLKESKEYKIGQTIRITADEQEYELLIECAAYTDERSEYVRDAKQVLMITYTYTNQSDTTLLIDDIRFQMLKNNSADLCEPYYFSDVLMPQPIEKGESCTAQIAYTLEEKEQPLVLVYQDAAHGGMVPVKIVIDDIM